MLKRVEKDLHAADELVGHVRLTIRQSGHSAMFEYAMRETWPCCSHASKFRILSFHCS